MPASLAVAYPPEFLRLLSHDRRWAILSALAGSDRKVQELVDLLGRPQNVISYHLRQLRDRELVSEHRSAADHRDIYYSLDLDRVRRLYADIGAALHPALADAQPEPGPSVAASGLPPTRVLFLCTHNSARSQMAEALLRYFAGDRVEAFSAGNRPTAVQPYAAQVLAQLDIDISQARSKHLDEFRDQKFDYIITVCDRLRESCPVFPGDPVQIHWSLPDPSAVEGSEADKLRAYRDVYTILLTRIRYLVTLIDRGRREQR